MKIPPCAISEILVLYAMLGERGIRIVRGECP